MNDPLQDAARRFAQAERVRVMIEHLRALIEGRTTREQVEAWTQGLIREGSGQHSLFVGHPTAYIVFVSLTGLTECRGDDEVLRVGDLRAYLDWLVGGETFYGAREPLVGLPLDIEVLAERTRTTPVRSWFDGLGWSEELRFCASTNGRPFSAFTLEHWRGGVEIREQRGDPWRDALIDLFETLAIDERDVTYLREDVDLAQLPVWSFWREDDNANRFEIEQFRSYAKAERQVQLFQARGHRQFYWVEPADQNRSE